MRLIFMGTPEFSIPTLNALVKSQHNVLCVYTQPPRAAGRGKKTQLSAVHSRAHELGLPVKTPNNLNNSVDIDEFAELKPDAVIVVAYGQILPEKILKIPKKGCINIHASLLPRWRGAAPIHRAIISGDHETGICIMSMELGLDTGPIIAQERTPILKSDTTRELSSRLAFLGSEMLIKVLTYPQNINMIKQSEEGVTYAKKINKIEARIDWSLSADRVECLVRGLSNFPGAWTMHNGVRLKLLDAELVEKNGPIGTIIDESGVVACGSNAIRILSIQRPGKAEQDWKSFTHGYQINHADILN